MVVPLIKQNTSFINTHLIVSVVAVTKLPPTIPLTGLSTSSHFRSIRRRVLGMLVWKEGRVSMWRELQVEKDISNFQPHSRGILPVNTDEHYIFFLTAM